MIIKSSVIRLRMTEAEAQLFRIKAAESGCKTASEYIRMKCVGEDGEISETSSADTDGNAVKKVKKAKKYKID